MSAMARAKLPDLLPDTAAFYRDVMETLLNARIPFLLGGAYAFEVYTDIGGRTKDLDLFIRAADVRRALSAARRRGWSAEIHSRHWIGKIHDREHFVDFIYNSGNGLCPVDDEWFDNARPSEVFGLSVQLAPIEEMIWQKAFIQERERYDGSDVAHLIRVHGRTLDWERLLKRFDRNWPVLFAHLVLYDYIYPSERDRVPGSVLAELTERLAPQLRQSIDEKICNGTILSRQQYLVDVEQLGFIDGRLREVGGRLTAEDVAFETKRLRKEQATGIH
jgi:hypothetical protein